MKPFLLSILVALHTLPAPTDSEYGYEEHTISDGETLSEILHHRGVCSEELYKQGWLRKNQLLNPQIKEWDKLPAGTTIHLCLPRKPIEKEKVPPEAETSGGEKPEVKQPYSPPTEVAAPQIKRPVARKVARHKKQASEKQSLTSGSIGMRYGYSLTSAQLLSRLRFFNVFAESQASLLTGFRFYLDIVPVGSEKVKGLDLAIGWRRYAAGWVFAWKTPIVIDEIQFVPKLGSFTFRSTLPGRTGAGKKSVDNIRLNDNLSYGYELDAKFSIYGSRFRPWFAQDLSQKLVNHNANTRIYSTRGGLDFLINTPLPSLVVHMNLMAFTAWERLDIERKDNIPQGASDFTLRTNIIYSGLGVLLNW